MGTPKNIIGNRLKRARKNDKNNATQKDVSARLEIRGICLSDSSIGKIENGTRPVTDIQLVAFANALNVSAAWLLGETEDATPQK